MLNNYFYYFGLKKIKTDEKNQNTTKVEYNPPNDISLVKRHLNYLKEIDNQNKNRQSLIENKNSQLVGQASIIISIFALFIPLLISKLLNLNIFILIFLIFVFSLILFHYIMAIYHSTRTLEINRYKYAAPSINTVTIKEGPNTEKDFIVQEINDLIYIIPHNSIQNNRKGENLIFATRNFRFASIIFSLFTILIIFSSFFILSKPQEIKISSLDKKVIKLLDLKFQDYLKEINIQSELKDILFEIRKYNSKKNNNNLIENNKYKNNNSKNDYITNHKK